MPAFNIGELFGTVTIRGTSEATAGLGRVQAGFTGAGDAAERSAGAVGAAEAALNGAGRAAGMASTSQAKLRAAQLSALAATERYNAVLADESSSLARTASAEAAAIRATERLAAAQDAAAPAATRVAVAQNVVNETALRTPGAMARAGSSFVSAAKSASGLVAIFGAFEIVKKALDISHEATQFQAAITRIQTQAGAAAGELDNFSSALLKMAPGVAQAPEDLATSLYHVYSATKALGYTGPQMLKAVDIAAKGATVSGADLEETTNALTATMVSGLGSVNNMGKAMGALNAIVGAGDMKLQDLNAALGTGILAVAKVFGVTLSQAGAALAVFGDNNIRGAKAATTLRMVIQDLTKPAASASDVLGKIGLSVTSLRDDLQKGGLSLALDDLKRKLNAAGVTGDKVGGFIEDAFTKKAGVGLAMLLNNLDQYIEKQTQISTGARNFGAEWSATTKTARYALDRLWTSIEAGGIVLTGKLNPAIAASATWLGTSVPHALSVLSGVLGPTVHMVGVALVGAWHAAIAVLRPVLGALGAVGHLLARNAEIVRDAAGLVIGLWAAYKGYTIAVVAVRAVTAALAQYRAALISTSVAGQGAGANLARFVTAGGPAAAAVVGVAVAVGALGKRLSDWIENGDAGISVMHHLAEATSSWKSALEAANGALSANVYQTVADSLQLTDLPGKAARAGISLTDLVDAVTGSKKNFDEFAAQWKSLGASDDTINGLRMEAAAFYGVRDGVKSTAAAAKLAAEQHKQLHTAIDQVGQESNGAIRPIEHLGETVKHIAPAVETGKDAIKSLTPQLAAAGRTATQTGTEFLSAVSTFMQSGRSVADRAALIGATLKGAGGDTLAYASALNASAGALHDLKTNLEQAASQVGKNGESTKQLLGNIVNLKTGTIDYNKSAAAPLISGLQSIQSAAMNAAEATYQHQRATENGKQAAIDAYHVYKSQTQPQLIDQLKNLGLNTDQAQALAQKYLGMPKEVRTLIKQEGGDPIVTVLNKIGHQLSFLTGHPWLANVRANTSGATGPLDVVIGKLQTIGRGASATITVHTPTGTLHIPNAAGTQAAFGRSTIPPNTAFTVGERGWEGGVTDSQGRTSIFSNSQSKAMGFHAPVGYANGTGGITTKTVAGKKVYEVGGIEYSTKAAAENAVKSQTRQTGETRASGALTRIGLDTSSFSWMRFQKQIANATDAIKLALAAGISHSQYVSLQQRLANADKRGREIERKLDATAHKDAAKLGRSVSDLHNLASGSDVIGEIHSLEHTLQQAGLPRDFIKGLADENKQILGLVASRNRAAAMLAKANAAMAKAKSAEMQDFRSFRSATVGGFDITTAGQNANGVVTAGSLLASQNQDLARTKAWVSGIDKLAGMKIFPGAYLRQLVGAGPASLGTVRALLSMKHGQLAQFARQERQIFALGTDVSQHVVARLDTKRLREADKREQHAQKREDKRQEKLEGAIRDEMRALGHEIKHLHLEGKLHLTRGELALIVEAGQNDNHKRRGHKS